MAAELCTPDDGRCYWDWRFESPRSRTRGIAVQNYKDSLPLLTDGSRNCGTMSQDSALVERLVELTVKDTMSENVQKYPHRRNAARCLANL
jgi:hypothetical protein